MSSAESRKNLLTDYATMQFKHHNHSTASLDRYATMNGLQYVHNPPQFRTSSPFTVQRYQQHGLSFSDHQPSVFTMNVNNHHTTDPHPELLSPPSTSSMPHFQQQSHRDHEWSHYPENTHYDYNMPNYHASYSAPSSYNHRLEPPLHDYQQANQLQPMSSGSGAAAALGSQRLSLAGSLDPTTGVFYRTPEHPRLRTAQACEKCRTRKAKCSGEHPSCKRCLTRGLICQYAKEGRVRGPNKPKAKHPLSAPTTPEVPAKALSAVDSPPPLNDQPHSGNETTASTKNLQLQTMSNHFRLEPTVTHQGFPEAGMQSIPDYSQGLLNSSVPTPNSTSQSQSLSQVSGQTQTSQATLHLNQRRIHSTQTGRNREQDSSPAISHCGRSSSFTQRDISPAMNASTQGTGINDCLSPSSLSSVSAASVSHSQDNMVPPPPPLASGIPTTMEGYQLNIPESHLEFNNIDMGTTHPQHHPHAQHMQCSPFDVVHDPAQGVQHAQYHQHHTTYHVNPHQQHNRQQVNDLRYPADAGMH